MKIKIFSISIILLFAGLFTACHDEVEPPTHKYNVRLTERLLSFLFDQNSYWVYKNAASGISDSLFLWSVEKDSFYIPPSGPGQGPQGYIECFNLNYRDYSDGVTNEKIEQLITDGISQHICNSAFDYGDGFIFFTSRNVGATKGNAKIAAIIDFLTIEDIDYFDVVKIKVNDDAYVEGDHYYYFANSI